MKIIGFVCLCSLAIIDCGGIEHDIDTFYHQCNSNLECQSGFCADLTTIGAPDKSRNVCSQHCSAAGYTEDCPNGYTCFLEDGLYYCAPTCETDQDCTQNPNHFHCSTHNHPGFEYSVCVGQGG